MPALNPLGGEIRVNPDEEGSQVGAFVVGLAGGNYVVFWYDVVGEIDAAYVLNGRVFAADSALVRDFTLGTLYDAAEIASFGATALANGGFAVIYSPDESASFRIQLFDATGVTVGTPIIPPDSVPAGTPSLAAREDGGFYAVYDSPLNGGTRLIAQRYGADGAAIDEPFEIAIDHTQPVSTVLPNGDLLVVWQDINQDEPGNNIHARIFSPEGMARGPVILVDAEAALARSNPAVTAFADGRFAVTWTNGTSDIVLVRLFDADGDPLGDAVQVDEDFVGEESAAQVIDTEDGGFLVTWVAEGKDESGAGLFARRFGADGQPVGQPRQINQTSEGSQFSGISNVSLLADGTLVFGWFGNGEQPGQEDDLGVFIRRFELHNSPGGGGPSANGGEISVFANGGLPLVAALTGGGYALAWLHGSGDFNFSGQVFDANGQPVGSGFTLPNTDTQADEENYPSLTALAGGGFVIAYVRGGATQNDPDPTVLQRFDATGSPVGAQITLSADSVDIDPQVIALPDGGFIAIYDMPASPDALTLGRRFDANGAPVGDPFTISTTFNNYLSAALLGNGNFVLASDNGPPTSQLRIFDQSGNLVADLGSFFPNNIYQEPSVAALASGGFVVVFDRDNDLKGRVFDVDGNPIGGEFSVNTTTADTQQYATVRGLDGGGFVVSWESNGQDGDSAGIYARLFDASGNATSDEFLVNQTTAGAQRGEFTNVDQLANGDLVFAWWGDGSNGFGVYTRIFDLPAANLPTPGDDVLEGTGGADLFDLSEGGNDRVSGGAGNDGFYFGAALTADDRVDGGPGGDDQVALRGAYMGATALGLLPNTIVGVETIALLSESDTRFGGVAGASGTFDYDITTADETVAAGELLIVNANGLQAGEDLTFDGSAETNGAFRIFGGFGTENLTGGAGNDGFFFGEGRYNPAADQVNGGGGTDNQLGLRGDYSGGVAFAANALTNIQTVALISSQAPGYGNVATPFSYALTFSDGNVAAGALMTVTGAGLQSDEVLTANGAAETNGRFRMIGGAGDDTLIGGAGNDSFWGGLGADMLDGNGGDNSYIYTDVAQSRADAADQLFDFDAGDVIDLAAIDANSGAAGNQDFTYIGAASFSGAAGELRAVDLGGGQWRIEGNVDADLDAELIILVTSQGGFTFSDMAFLGLAP